MDNVSYVPLMKKDLSRVGLCDTYMLQFVHMYAYFY